jgi:hypothetical protein
MQENRLNPPNLTLGNFEGAGLSDLLANDVVFLTKISSFNWVIFLSNQSCFGSRQFYLN